MDATRDSETGEWWRCAVCQIVRNLRTGLSYETSSWRQVPNPHGG